MISDQRRMGRRHLLGPLRLNLLAGLLARIYSIFSHNKTALAGLSAGFNTSRISPKLESTDLVLLHTNRWSNEFASW